MFSKLNKSKFLHDSPPQESDDAPDSPPTVLVTCIVVFSFIFIFICVALSFPVTEKLVEMQESKVNSGMGNAERIIYISGQKQIMSSYKKMDDGHYTVPIQQAMKSVVATQGDISGTDSGSGSGSGEKK